MLKKIALIIAIVAVNNIITATPGASLPLYYGSFFIAFIFGIEGGRVKTNGYMVFLVLAALLSLIVNHIPSYFKANERFISFLIGVGLLSPLFKNKELALLRQIIFKYINRFLLCIVVFSFIGRITGLFPVTGVANLFQGVTTNPMLLAPISAISILISVWGFYKMTSNFKFRYIFLFQLILSFLCLLLSGSRIAILGLVMGFFLFLFKIYQKRMGKFMRIIFFLLLLVIASSSIWMNYTDTLMKKFEYGEAQGDITASRTNQWEHRINEFKESPVFGIGFATLHEGLYDETTGIIEPATSWGAFFSMTGLLGGLSFLLLVGIQFYKLFRDDSYSLETALFVGILCFFMIHWIAEGYMLASGSFLFFYSWLVLGIIDIYNDQKKLSIL